MSSKTNKEHIFQIERIKTNSEWIILLTDSHVISDTDHNLSIFVRKTDIVLFMYFNCAKIDAT
jgi:hypothetical protein